MDNKNISNLLRVIADLIEENKLKEVVKTTETSLSKAQIMEQILEFGSGDIQTFGGKYDGGINLQQIPIEITECVHLLLSQKNRYENFLEVGAAGGGLSFLFHHFFNLKNVVVIDENFHHQSNSRSKTLKHIKPKEFIGNSQGPEAKNFVKNLNIEFDLMFIDADHSYQGVKNDTNNYLEFLKSGGFLMFHDIESFPSVRQWHDELKNNPSLELVSEIVSCGNLKCGIGIFKKK